MQEVTKINPKLPSATLISILPFPIIEKKIGLFPGQFNIPAAKVGDIECLTVQGVIARNYIDEGRGHLDIDQAPEKLAESICFDFESSLVVQGDDVKPGLFWVPGCHPDKSLEKVDTDQVKKLFSERILEARRLQTNWFRALVEMAEGDWIRYGKNPRMVTEMSKHAARALNLRPEWMRIEQADASVQCPACMTSISAEALVCATCKTIVKPKEYKARFQSADELVKA